LLSASASLQRWCPLLIVSAALIAAQPLINRCLVKHRPEHGYAAASIVVPFLVSVYGGYFGAAQGIMFAAGMGLLLPRKMGDLNALRILNAMVNTVVAALTFIVLEARHPTGAVNLHAALPVGIGSLLGGWVGVRMRSRQSQAGGLRRRRPARRHASTCRRGGPSRPFGRACVSSQRQRAVRWAKRSR
jgi:uncharacterized membrane protein YfcA